MRKRVEIDQPEGPAVKAWGGHAAPLVGEIGAGLFYVWFGEATLTESDPVVIEVRKPFQRDWIQQHLAPQLHRSYGAFVVRCSI